MEQFCFGRCPDNLYALCDQDSVGQEKRIKRRDMVADQYHTTLRGDVFTPLDPHVTTEAEKELNY